MVAAVSHHKEAKGGGVVFLACGWWLQSVTIEKSEQQAPESAATAALKNQITMAVYQQLPFSFICKQGIPEPMAAVTCIKGACHSISLNLN